MYSAYYFSILRLAKRLKIFQAIGVFLDTIIICTLTGFVVIMAHAWQGDNGSAWMELGKLPKYVASASVLSHGGIFTGIDVPVWDSRAE